MIIARFFTGVTIKYPTADFFQSRPDGFFEICKGTNENKIVIAIIQPTAGAILERADNLSEMTHPAFPDKKVKTLMERIVEYGSK